MPTFRHCGRLLFYRDQGQGPLLVILPGNTASSASLIREQEYYGRYCRAVALDFWGTGGSDRVEVWPENWWETGAQDVAGLIEHIGEQQAILMGASGGADDALLAAINFPDRVRAVIADGSVERDPAGRLKELVAERSRRTMGQISFWKTSHGEDWPQVVEADSAMLLRFSEGGGDFFGGRLSAIRCPVLLTASLADEMLPEVAIQLPAMARQIPDCRLYLLNQGYHPLMWSQATEFRDL